MNQTDEFEIRIAADADAAKIEELMRAEIENGGKIKVDATKQTRSIGMTGAEIAISFGINIVTSVLVQVYRDEIDAAAKKVGDATKTVIRVIFRGKKD